MHGDGGVGKDHLNQEVRKLASESGALAASTDEQIDDVASVMTAIAGEFRRGGTPLVEFEKRVAVYQKRRRKLESDPHAPGAVASLVTKAAVTIGVHVDRSVPIPDSLLAPLQSTTLADQLNQTNTRLALKFSDHYT